MKDLFPEFYRPTTDAFASLWKEGLIVPDASVLLNLYGYSEATQKEFLSIFTAVEKQLRLPYQFALEYHKNRPKAIIEHVNKCLKVEQALADLHKKEMDGGAPHTLFPKDVSEHFEKVQKAVVTARKRQESMVSNDPVLDQLTTLFNGRVSPKPDAAQLLVLHSDAKTRYSSETPPGYLDLKEKGEPDAFGDYIGWSQILHMADMEKKSVILITDDAKDDWWQIKSGRTIGPRLELVAEFMTRCADRTFYMYSSEQFLKRSAEFLTRVVPTSAIEEVAQQREITFVRTIPSPKTAAKQPSVETSEFWKQIAEALAKVASAEKRSPAPPESTPPPSTIDPKSEPKRKEGKPDGPSSPD